MVMSDLNQQNYRDVIQRICERALIGEIGLEEFHSSWPVEANEDPFYQQLFDDVEDGVEHLPGNPFTGRTNYKLWYSSYEYLLIYLDCMLIRSGKDTAQLMACRDAAIKQKVLSKATIEESVVKCTGSSPSS
jgi:hypothetical protein